MEEILYTIIMAFIYFLYILLIPVIMLIATPFIWLWPGRKTIAGERQKKDIRGRYRKIWKIWESLGRGWPSP